MVLNISSLLVALVSFLSCSHISGFHIPVKKSFSFQKNKNKLLRNQQERESIELLKNIAPLEGSNLRLPSRKFSVNLPEYLGSNISPFMLLSTIIIIVSFTDNALADTTNKFVDMSKLTPQNFQPVCPASDGLYRFLQITTESVVGKESFVEYGPLIAGGLLRVRLELCVVESFFNEAVGPFIKQNGLRWILPLHETVETFLAGTIFALATTFILVGSTKLVTIIITYGDFFVGVPFRSVGGFAFDRARGKPVTLDIGFGPFKTRVIGPKEKELEKMMVEKKTEDGTIDLGDNPVFTVLSGGVKSVGEASKVVREIIEAIDLFVGRYLVLYASGYIALKFVHFKIFPDFP